MKRLFGQTFDILQKAIELRTERNTVLAGNIANIDTPGYKSKDLPFEEIISKYMTSVPRSSELEISNPNHMDQEARLAGDPVVSSELEELGLEHATDSGEKFVNTSMESSETESLTVTDKDHFSNGIQDSRDGLLTVSEERGVPNNVDIDQQMAKLAENNLQYQAAVQALMKEFDLIRQAVTEGGKA